MQPQPGDVVVQGKKGLDAFPGTDLEEQLKARGIETVVLGGFLTNCCVESVCACNLPPTTDADLILTTQLPYRPKR